MKQSLDWIKISFKTQLKNTLIKLKFSEAFGEKYVKKAFELR